MVMAVALSILAEAGPWGALLAYVLWWQQHWGEIEALAR